MEGVPWKWRNNNVGFTHSRMEDEAGFRVRGELSVDEVTGESG